jgi:glycosyltransferase involved in cell wall biosynthesis
MVRSGMSVVLMAKPGGAQTGIGRYVTELTRGLEARGRPAPVVWPSTPLPGWMTEKVKQAAGFDLPTFFANFPAWAAWPRADVYHLTSQNLASVLYLRRPPGKVIVTVHDIIPFLVRHDPALCSYQTPVHRRVDYLATWALRQADALIADSHETAASLTRVLGIPTSRITVAHLGVDRERFHPGRSRPICRLVSVWTRTGPTCCTSARKIHAKIWRRCSGRWRSYDATGLRST